MNPTSLSSAEKKTEYAYITLSQLLLCIKDVINSEFGSRTFWVVAEIAKVHISKSGHCFLELVEKDGISGEINSQANAVVWEENYKFIDAYFYEKTGEHLREGLKILFNCYVDFHEVYGLKLVIFEIKPEFTLGEMYLVKEQIINRLEKEGLLIKNKGIPLHPVIQNIAIISSPSSSGLKDFIDELSNNPYGFKFYYHIFEALVQGEGAKDSIIGAFERIKPYINFFDVVVIIRGGGSKIDLNCFDNYELARYVALFPLPVITGIGHQPDVSCLDMVAHTNLKTPTACAKFIIDRTYSFYSNLQNLLKRITESISLIINSRNTKLQEILTRLHYNIMQRLSEEKNKIFKFMRIGSSVEKIVQQKNYHIKEFSSRLKNIMLYNINKERNTLYELSKKIRFFVQNIIQEQKYQLKTYIARLENVYSSYIKEAKHKIEKLENSVKLLDPVNVLKRGYSITYYNNRPVKSIKELGKNVRITTKLYDGEIISIVEKLFKEGEGE